MDNRPRRNSPVLFALIGLICFSLIAGSRSLWAQTPSPPPATAAQAAQALDLSRFELIDPAGDPNFQVIAGQSYHSKLKLAEVARQLREKLKQAGCEELDGATITDAYGSASYRKQGFGFSLTLTSGSGGEGTSVTLVNHGNVDLTSLPVPKTAQRLYSFPAVVAYSTEQSVEEAREEIRKQLLEQGWQPFGETTVSFFLKQNAVRLQVMVSTAPAQGNKTSIQITSEQLSADLPAPPYAGMLQYSDNVGNMLFDSDKTQAELVDYFKNALASGDWTATTEAPIRIGFRDHLIFRNPAKEYLELRFQEVNGKRRVDLKYQTAAQFVETEQKATAAIEARKKEQAEAAERKANPPKVAVPAPVKAKPGGLGPKNLEFTIDSGTAATAVAAWLKTQQEAGWKLNTVVDTKEAGVYKLSREGQELHVDFVDPGFIPGKITIKAFGEFQLELKK